MSGFIKLPRSLRNNIAWEKALGKHKAIFYTILERAAFKKTQYNIHGNIFDIEPGQLCASMRDIAQWTGKDISKNDVEGAIKYFIKVKFLRQSIRHGKTVLTICESDVYEGLTNISQTDYQTEVRQGSDIKEEYKERKEKKEKTPPPKVPEKTEPLKEVAASPKVEVEEVVQKKHKGHFHPPPVFWEVLQAAENSKFPIPSRQIFDLSQRYDFEAIIETIRLWRFRTEKENASANSLIAVFISDVKKQEEYLEHKRLFIQNYPKTACK